MRVFLSQNTASTLMATAPRSYILKLFMVLVDPLGVVGVGVVLHRWTRRYVLASLLGVPVLARAAFCWYPF